MRKIDLPTNINMCKRRLKSVIQKLKRIKRIEDYDYLLKDQIERGFIERIEDLGDDGKRVHYLPHFAVLREESETTKLRVVYDASAKVNNNVLSLNDALHTGPSLLPEMIFVLW